MVCCCSREVRPLRVVVPQAMPWLGTLPPPGTSLVCTCGIAGEAGACCASEHASLPLQAAAPAAASSTGYMLCWLPLPHRIAAPPTRLHQPTFEVLAVAVNSGLVAFPTAYTRVWSGAGGAIWRPLPPPGYVAVGDVVTSDGSEPELSAMVCLHGRSRLGCPCEGRRSGRRWFARSPDCGS